MHKPIAGRDLALRSGKIPFPFLIAMSLTLATGVGTSAIGSDADSGARLYTTYSFFYEIGAHRTTNYRKGILVPINTEVTMTPPNQCNGLGEQAEVTGSRQRTVHTNPCPMESNHRYCPKPEASCYGDPGSITIELTASGTRIRIDNLARHSGEDIAGIFARMFSATPTDLSPFSESERRHILAGTVDVGMSKDAVILALGHPPKHKTPSLDANQWRYWQNRFNTFVVEFDGGKVSQIVD